MKSEKLIFQRQESVSFGGRRTLKHDRHPRDADFLPILAALELLARQDALLVQPAPVVRHHVIVGGHAEHRDFRLECFRAGQRRQINQFFLEDQPKLVHLRRDRPQAPQQLAAGHLPRLHRAAQDQVFDLRLRQMRALVEIEQVGERLVPARRDNFGCAGVAERHHVVEAEADRAVLDAAFGSALVDADGQDRNPSAPRVIDHDVRSPEADRHVVQDAVPYSTGK